MVPVYVMRSMPAQSSPDAGQPLASSTVMVVSLGVTSAASRDVYVGASRFALTLAVSSSAKPRDSPAPTPLARSIWLPMGPLVSMTRLASSWLCVNGPEPGSVKPVSRSVKMQSIPSTVSA